MTAVGMALVLAGCGDDTPARFASVNEGDVVVRVEGDRLVVRNEGEHTVRIAAVESRTLRESLAQWCFGGADCGAPVGPGAEGSIALRDVMGFHGAPATITVVHWQPGDVDVARLDVTVR